MHVRRVLLALALPAVLLLASCRATGGAAADPSKQARITVENNLPIPAVLSISLLTQSGSTVPVGVVGPGRTRVLAFDGSNLIGPVRFTARPPGGEARVSNALPVSTTSELYWDVQANVLREQ